MLISLQEFTQLPWSSKPMAIDFETTGLKAYGGDKAFLISAAWHDDSGQPQARSYKITGDSREQAAIQAICSSARMLIAHNAKFEMHFLWAQWQARPLRIWDTMVMERVVYNDHMSYSLDNCSKRHGLAKIEIKKYMDKNKLFTRTGSKPGDKNYHFDKVPDSEIVPYCENDALLCLELYRRQSETFRQWDASANPIRHVIALECKTTQCLFDMERRGLLLDQRLTEDAYNYYNAKAHEALEEFKQHTFGTELVDSAASLHPILSPLGIKPGLTEKGEMSYNVEILEASKHPLPAIILKHRDAHKRMETYFGNFMRLVQSDGLIHPSIFQAGAASFRFSVRDPSCQNWPDDWDDKKRQWSNPYPVRRAFVARPGCSIVSIDYAQMELRKMADEAGEMDMIRAFRDGRDFHQETADMAGVSRGLAKNGRFAKLYGAGVARVATTLKIEESLAARICQAIDASSPKIKQYTRQLINLAKSRPYVTNWYGRRYHFKSDFVYKFPNYRIQGGCSDILRIAICAIDDMLKAEAKGNTFMQLPIHDELVFNVDACDRHLIPEFRRLMIEAHQPVNGLAMDASVSEGVNFADIEKTG